MPRTRESLRRWRAIQTQRPGEQKSPFKFLEIRTPDEVAKIMGISRQRVQQIEREILHKLRIALKEDYENLFK
jgi:DNA-directed RNA polymerase sigma subunit (sigma70/sigma32)